MNTGSRFLTVIVVVLIAWLGWSFWDAYRPQAMVMQGQIEATEYTVSSKVPGRIAEVLVRKGDPVEVGQLVFRIDSPELEAKLSQAVGGVQAASAIVAAANTGARAQEIEAARDQWQTAKAAEELTTKTLERMENLLVDGVIPQQRRDEVYAAHEAAKYTTQAAYQIYSMASEGARVETKAAARGQEQIASGVVAEVEAMRKDTEIHSRWSGEVATVFLHSGELAPQGFPIVTIVDIDDAWAVFQVREDYLKSISKGAEINVRIPALGEDSYTFKISHISVMGDFATWRATNATAGYDLKTFEVEARPLSSIKGLRVGMTTLLEF
jgi:HlyD family secretion protein